MILHTINKVSAWGKCEGLISENDQVLLLEDGVYLALSLRRPCAVLSADAAARGLTGHLPDGARLMDYGDFVGLAARADKVCAWF